MNFTSLAAAVVLATGLSFAAPSFTAVPAGWLLTGSHPQSYEVGTSPQGGSARGPAAYLRAKESSLGFGTLMQMIQAADYAGQRVRLSANVRTEDVAKWSSIWMRVDGPRGVDGKAPMLAFDNMQARPIQGTTGWQRYEVVLDVAPEAAAIAYGLMVIGDGAAWMEDVKVEAVPTSIPTTALPHPPADPLPRRPQNLNFGN